MQLIVIQIAFCQTAQMAWLINIRPAVLLDQFQSTHALYGITINLTSTLSDQLKSYKKEHYELFVATKFKE